MKMFCLTFTRQTQIGAIDAKHFYTYILYPFQEFLKGQKDAQISKKHPTENATLTPVQCVTCKDYAHNMRVHRDGVAALRNPVI